MADHSELMSEFPQVEKMTTEERMKHARKRRTQQLKRWSQREKEYLRDTQRKKKKTETNKKTSSLSSSSRAAENKVHFVPSVMLLEAAARGDVEEVQRLLMLGFNPDSTNEDGLTALHQCCIDNNEEMMKLLLEFGANVNSEDTERWTPLHAASTCGHLNLVKYLISKGANLLCVNADGNMPYDICEDEATLDYIETEMSNRGVTQELIDETRSATETLMLSDLKWLAKQNGDLDYHDRQGATPLHIAAANGFTSIVGFLLDQNVVSDSVDNDLWQPIHAAACWGHLEVLEMLVQSGASLDAKTKNGETPFDICEDLEMRERMFQLKDEMDIKKSVQTQRLRRTQSQNTRSQSVRRTSLRDKNHMTRKEVMEEAKIRLVHQGIQPDTEIKSQVNAINPVWSDVQLELENPDKENIEKNLNVSTMDHDHICVSIDGKPKLVIPVSPFNRVPKQDENDGVIVSNGDHRTVTVKSQDDMAVAISAKRKDMNTNGNGVVSYGYHSDMLDNISNPNSSSSLRPSSPPPPRDVKLDLSIHVTVNTTPTTNGNNVNTSGSIPINNANTLAELKRQRNDTRKRHSGSVSTVDSNMGDDVVANGHGLELNHIGVDFSPVSSPTLTRRKFMGSVSEDIGSSRHRNCCCIIL